MLFKWLLLIFNLCKTPLGETGCLSILFIYLFIYFFECLGIQFFNSLTCDLRGTMPYQMLPKLLPMEAEGFPRCGNHSKHIPMHIPLQFVIPPKFVFMHVNTTKILLVLKTFMKNKISSQTNQQP